MTPRRWGVGGWLVAAAAGLVAAGGLVGLLVWNRWACLIVVGLGVYGYACYRIPNAGLLGELEAARDRLSAYNASDSRADLAEAPLTPPGGTTEVDPEPPSWMDQSGYRPPARSMTAAEADALMANLQALPGDLVEQPFVHTPCGTPISVLDDGAEWCPTCGTFLDPEPLPDLDASDGPRSLPNGRID